MRRCDNNFCVLFGDAFESFAEDALVLGQQRGGYQSGIWKTSISSNTSASFVYISLRTINVEKWHNFCNMACRHVLKSTLAWNYSCRQSNECFIDIRFLTFCLDFNDPLIAAYVIYLI